MTGMRRGETLGLRWKDVDFDNGRVSVRQQLVKANGTTGFGQPKTAKGRRSLALDVGTTSILREHRRAMAAEPLAAGPLYEDLGAYTFEFEPMETFHGLVGIFATGDDEPNPHWDFGQFSNAYVSLRELLYVGDELYAYHEQSSDDLAASH